MKGLLTSMWLLWSSQRCGSVRSMLSYAYNTVSLQYNTQQHTGSLSPGRAVRLTWVCSWCCWAIQRRREDRIRCHYYWYGVLSCPFSCLFSWNIWDLRYFTFLYSFINCWWIRRFSIQLLYFMPIIYHTSGKCIDKYSSERCAGFSEGEAYSIDPRLEAIVNRMFAHAFQISDFNHVRLYVFYSTCQCPLQMPYIYFLFPSKEYILYDPCKCEFSQLYCRLWVLLLSHAVRT